jgi:hypothetical protein
MRARLLFTYLSASLPDGSRIPFAPPLIIEDDKVGLFTSDWVHCFEAASLDTLSEEQVRQELHIDEATVVTLTPIRALPTTDLTSETVTIWRQNWWREAARGLQRSEALRCAS